MALERDPNSSISCFIIAPLGPLSDLLRMQLNQENVICLRLDVRDPLWQPSVQVTTLIERADFVAAILEGEPSANLYFELGIAMGAGKPVLLFNDSSKLPSALASATTVLTSAIRDDSWKDVRRAFLRTVHPTQGSSKRKSSKKAIGGQRWKKISDDFDVLRSGAKDSSSVEFERLVEKAFQLAGFTISQAPSGDFGADFALASPIFSRSFGLPVLIEVKNNLRTPVRQETVYRLDQLVANGRGGAALLVTLVPLSVNLPVQPQKPVVIVPFDEVVGWLRAGTFEDDFLFTVDAFWERPK